MKIPIPKTQTSLEKLMRRLDYQLDRKNKSNEKAFYRRMRSSRFPRFHIYIAEKEDRWIFKLHLDQKPNAYQGQAAHGGEYEGPKVEEEANRIKHGVAAILKEEKSDGDVDEDKNGVEKSNLARNLVVGAVLVLVLLLAWQFIL